ncbi:FecR domain-containing protein [Azoarcus olearius]|uniref:Transmembrane sensor n=1 Tax=Azoarcus sp. (strain BH72) TaxID=418699 RepID=A1K836_AZOSB|nr:FecR domain-containing protein [Azoarcus olearius]CAL94991.1 putative transmembrane sensor [Azoarcus olearius]
MASHAAIPAGDKAHVPAAALEQAAEWFVLLASGEADAEDHRRWLAWRAGCPSHEAAWQRVESLSGRFREVPPPFASVAIVGPSRGAGRRRALKQLAVLLATGAGAWGVQRSYQGMVWSASATTAIGEQRDWVLADGSRLTLDTDSALAVDFGLGQRLIRLQRGRVLVETAPDPAPIARSIAVETAQGRVIALGTRFSVRQEAGTSQVVVLEARVDIRPADNANAGTILAAGDAVRFTRAGFKDRQPLGLHDTAWAKGLLMADNWSLLDLAAELSRYRRQPLSCDPRIAALRISGVFPLRDSDAALAAVTDSLPVRVERRAASLAIVPR